MLCRLTLLVVHFVIFLVALSFLSLFLLSSRFEPFLLFSQLLLRQKFVYFELLLRIYSYQSKKYLTDKAYYTQ